MPPSDSASRPPDDNAETTIHYEPGANRLFVFDVVYQERAAQEQAEKKKLGAFGLMARFVQRPREDAVTLVEHELRYEPFWHVVARREVDYVRSVTYTVPVGNPHARRVHVAGQAYDVSQSGDRSRIELAVDEHCHRKTSVDRYRTGLDVDAGRSRVTPAGFRTYVDRYRATEVEQMDRPGMLPLRVSPPTVRQEAQVALSTEAVDAHRITSDEIVFEKLHLYSRPVYAFKYRWADKGAEGVVEIDGLTGETVQNGEWARGKMDQVLTRDALFEVGADIASLIVPGAGIPIKVIDRATRPPGLP